MQEVEQAPIQSIEMPSVAEIVVLCEEPDHVIDNP